VKDYLLNLSLKSKRSVLMDLASISTKYLREYSTSSRLEIISNVEGVEIGFEEILLVM